MKSRKARAVPARLGRGRERFDRWRKRRERRTIPEGLWSAAVKLAEEYGVHRTARTLRLNNESLKKRVEAATQRAQPLRDRPASFWELMPSAGSGASASPECIVEVEDGSGRKLRVQWKGEFAELSALSQSLWRST